MSARPYGGCCPALPYRRCWEAGGLHGLADIMATTARRLSLSCLSPSGGPPKLQRRRTRWRAKNGLLRRLQDRDIVRDRGTAHVEDATELRILDLHALRRLPLQLHRRH